MDVAMNGLSFEICLVYLDDIIVFSPDLDTHLGRIRLVLQRLKDAGLKLKPSKCHLLQKTVSFLGHVVSGDGIATDPEKTRAVNEWPVPTCLRDTRAFIGLCSYYRRFIKGFADIAAPLHALTKKGVRFRWTPECQVAFQRLKDALSTPPVLAMPDDNAKFIVDTDASLHSTGAVLSMEKDGREYVIAYASRKFDKAQSNFCVTRKELWAGIWALKQFRQYLLGRHFVLRTDHSALTWFKKSRDLIGQPGRWLEFMEEFDFDIVHRAGSRHGNADALSRRPCPKTNCVCHDLDSPDPSEDCRLSLVNSIPDQSYPSFLWTPEELASAQDKDREINWIKVVMKAEQDKPSWE
jgi:hypothetical protein